MADDSKDYRAETLDHVELFKCIREYRLKTEVIIDTLGNLLPGSLLPPHSPVRFASLLASVRNNVDRIVKTRRTLS
jgi:hypothetical protein